MAVLFKILNSKMSSCAPSAQNDTAPYAKNLNTLPTKDATRNLQTFYLIHLNQKPLDSAPSATISTKKMTTAR